MTGATRVRLAAASAEHRSGAGAVVLQLAAQLVGGGEPPDIAEPFHPFEPHPLAVEVALESEEVRLERRTAFVGLAALVLSVLYDPPTP